MKESRMPRASLVDTTVQPANMGLSPETERELEEARKRHGEPPGDGPADWAKHLGPPFSQ